MGVNKVTKAVFLDRDGVINKSIIRAGKPYPPASLKELELISGVKEGIHALRENGYFVFVVTNQPDVARGTTSETTVSEINDYLFSQLEINEIFTCFHDDADNCICRKPKPGMLLMAADKYGIDLRKSFLVGDRWRDIESGIQAGVTTILIDYGYDEKKIAADFECTNFSESINFILKN